MKTRILKPMLVMILFSWLEVPAQIYVNCEAAGANDGTTWADAYTDLQTAISIAAAGDEIWVTRGSYAPAGPNGSTSATFLIDKNVRIFGGFEGDEISVDERILEANTTYLTGDLLGNDIENDLVTNRKDNVRTILTVGSQVTDATVIDGFVFRNGYAGGKMFDTSANRSGGGLYSKGYPRIKNCHFIENYAAYGGGGAYFAYAGNKKIEVSNCIFFANQAERGGGLYLGDAVLDLDNTRFINNMALDGGGVLYSSKIGGATTNVLNCNFTGNKAAFGGGMKLTGMANENWFKFENSFFMKNEATENTDLSQAGGGLHITIVSSSIKNYVEMIDCQFDENKSLGSGSGLQLEFSGIKSVFEMKGTQFKENVSGTSAALDVVGNDHGYGFVVVENSLFEKNIAGNSAALRMGTAWNEGGTFEFYVRNSTFKGNEANEGGAIGLWSNETANMGIQIERCVIDQNKATINGGGLLINAHSPKFSAIITHSYLTSNESPLGSALDAYMFTESPLPTGAEVLMDNCLVAKNAGDHAAIATDALPHLKLLNNTIADNRGGGVMVANKSGFFAQNNVLANPGFRDFLALSEDVTATSLGGNLTYDLSFKNIVTSTDLMRKEPRFKAGTYEPTIQSPMVNKGIGKGVSATVDLLGNKRIQQKVIDVGAFESPFLAGEPNSPPVIGLVVSPSPASEYINVKLPATINNPHSATLHDQWGRLVRLQYLSQGQPFDLHGLEPGMYTIRIVEGQQVYVSSFIKQ